MIKTQIQEIISENTYQVNDIVMNWTQANTS